MQLGSFIKRKDGGEIRFIIVKGRWAYETGAKSWCRTEVFLDRWEAIAE